MVNHNTYEDPQLQQSCALRARWSNSLGSLKVWLGTLVLTIPALLSSPPIPEDTKQLACLAANVYHEARGEPKAGQLAVAYVTLNRAKNSSICTEVFRPYQFSWTLTKPMKYDIAAIKVAEKALNTESNFKATHFHTIHVSPAWAKEFKRLKRIGNHVFYKEI